MNETRALRVARSSAVKARTQATNQIKALLVTGPEQLREQLRHLSTAALIAACAKLRPRSGSRGTANANRALYVVVLGRLRYDPGTRAYVERRTHEGLTKPEIIRCLKRYVAREICQTLPTPISDNPSRQLLARP